MLLPNGYLARVDPDKLERYLLSDTHPVGRLKAAFFRGIGYTLENWELLAAHLLEAAEHLPAVRTGGSYGPRYVVRCTLSARPGRSAEVDTIWMLDRNAIPRFITAYPAGRR